MSERAVAARPDAPPSASEAWNSYRHLADNSIDVVLEASLQTVIQWVSPSVEEVLGWAPEDLVGRSAPDVVHPDDIGEVIVLAEAINTQASRVRAARCRMLMASGTYKPMQLRGRPALDHAGTVVGHIITLQDTTERDDALRALTVLTEGNRILARADDEAALMRDMCTAVVETGDYPLAWYGRKELDEEKSVRPLAFHGPGASYMDSLRLSWGENELGLGPTGTSIRTHTTQVNQNFTGDPLFAPWREAAHAAGLHSSISLPVLVGGELDGALVVYAAEEHAFDERAQEILETLASDLGLGLERLRAVRALEEANRTADEQNARLRGVFDSQFDPFVLLEAVRDESGTAVDLRYVAASDAAIEFNRQTREQMIGHTLIEIFPGQLRDGSLDAYIQVIETGVPIVMDDFEYFHEPRQEHVRLDIRAVKSGDGVAITFRDVTARHEAAAALAESEARYRLLAENSSDVIWQATSNGTITWTSESVRSVLGWSPAEVIGHDIDLVHPDDRAAVSDSLRALTRGQIAQGEARIAEADGTWRWMSFTAHRATGAEGSVDVFSLRDIDDEIRARNALLHAIGHDPLTGMAARTVMLQRVGETLTRLSGRRLAAVLCIGVDRLSSINEAYTHAAGDVVLTTLARRIVETTGNPDLVGRGAGIEFLVAVPDISSGDEATALAERILTRAKGPVQIGDEHVEPTVSIGIAIGDRFTDPEQLVRDASGAMGQAKADGRDRFSFADASLADQARRRLDVERRLRDGVAEDRFVPYFQPVVDLSTGQLTGYEALVRYKRPDGSIAPPARFMSIAELSPIVGDLDMIMMRKCLAALADLPEHLSVAINLSTITLTRPGYAALIEQLIRESELRPSRIHLEVTETALLGESSQILDVMHSVGALGARWYVDDFGTGYSSISHLRDLPVSGLKLDVSFSAGIRNGDSKSVRLAQALAGLAGGLGLDTVAEGIESPDEAATLQLQGWRHGQGWLYGRPAPLA